MKRLTLTIPVRTSDNFGEPISKFLGFIELFNKEKFDLLEFNFSETKFISPFLIGGLTYLSILNEANGDSNSFVYNEYSSQTKGYLETIMFPKGFMYSGSIYGEIENVFQDYHNKTYTPIVSFPSTIAQDSNDCRERILSALNQILKNQLNLTGSFGTGIYYLIDELTQNIVDHSGAPKGMIFAQFFQSKNYMDISIFDVGKGLFQSYLDTDKHKPKNNTEALNFAVYGKSTKNIPESRGFGLSTSRDMLVNGLKGKFFIMSGNSFFIQTVDREEVIAVPEIFSIKGCYIALRVRILDNEHFNPYDYME